MNTLEINNIPATKDQSSKRLFGRTAKTASSNHPIR